MNTHYFTDNRHLRENRKELSFRFWCFNLRFTSDNGVFSKDGIDFGTRVLLETLREHKAELGDNLLDLGCGYGVIGITLKKAFPDKSVTMSEINPRAAQLAEWNAKQNDVQAEVLCGDGFAPLGNRCFSDIIINPPIRAGKQVIYAMFAQSYTHLQPHGRLWIVIRKAQGALSAHNYVKEQFHNCTILEKHKGYYILQAVREETSSTS